MCIQMKNGAIHSIKTYPQKKRNKKGDLKVAFFVRTRRFELPHPNGHHPLKVACLPISPRARLGIAKVENRALGSKASQSFSLLFLKFIQKPFFQQTATYCIAELQLSSVPLHQVPV